MIKTKKKIETGNFVDSESEAEEDEEEQEKDKKGKNIRMESDSTPLYFGVWWKSKSGDDKKRQDQKRQKQTRRRAWAPQGRIHRHHSL